MRKETKKKFGKIYCVVWVFVEFFMFVYIVLVLTSAGYRGIAGLLLGVFSIIFMFWWLKQLEGYNEKS